MNKQQLKSRVTNFKSLEPISSKLPTSRYGTMFGIAHLVYRPAVGEFGLPMVDSTIFFNQVFALISLCLVKQPVVAVLFQCEARFSSPQVTLLSLVAAARENSVAVSREYSKMRKIRPI